MDAAKNAARSCTTCSKAKAKCVKLPGHDICQRCSRLKKECHSRDHVIRKKKAAKPTRAAQLENLETKIEHLVNALSSSQPQRNSLADYGQPSPPVSEPASQTRSAELIQTLCCHDEDRAKPAPSTAAATASSTAPFPPLPEFQFDPHALSVPLDEAEVLLDRYMRLMAPSMPFVVIPKGTTAAELLVQKPFLLHAIVTVTYFHNLPLQQKLIKRVIRDVTERAMINDEKSLDVIQGILVLTMWYYPHIFVHQQMTNLLHIATAIMMDLTIDRTVKDCANDFKSTVQRPSQNMQSILRTASTEEHRVLTGIFFMTSMFCVSFRRIDNAPFAKFVEDALENLERAQEFESDIVLVQLTRLQQFNQGIYATEVCSAPAAMYIKAYTAELEKIKAGKPDKDINVHLQLQYLSSEARILELSFNELQEGKEQSLQQCLGNTARLVDVLRAFLDVYFSIPVSLYLTTPITIFSQFGHTFILLTKLACIEHNTWDLADFPHKINFLEVIEEAANRYEAAAKSTVDGIAIDNDGLITWAMRIRWMKQVYEARNLPEHERHNFPLNPKRPGFGGEGSEANKATMATPSSQADPPTGHTLEASQQSMHPDDVPGGDLFNYLDDSFWQAFSSEAGFPEIAI